MEVVKHENRMQRDTGNSILGGYSEVGQTCPFQSCNPVIVLMTAVILVTGPGKPLLRGTVPLHPLYSVHKEIQLVLKLTDRNCRGVLIFSDCTPTS